MPHDVRHYLAMSETDFRHHIARASHEKRQAIKKKLARARKGTQNLLEKLTNTPLESEVGQRMCILGAKQNAIKDINHIDKLYKILQSTPCTSTHRPPR